MVLSFVSFVVVRFYNFCSQVASVGVIAGSHKGNGYCGWLGHGSPNLCAPLGLTDDIEVISGFKWAGSGYSGGGRGESPG